jgi:hypothetical protein
MAWLVINWIKLLVLIGLVIFLIVIHEQVTHDLYAVSRAQSATAITLGVLEIFFDVRL